MPPRRRSATADSLTTDDLTRLAAAVTEGKRATVYLREGTPSLGLAPGSSARVVSVDGTTLVVRPRGVDDELPYEADELRMTKNVPEAPAPRTAKRSAKPAAGSGERPSAPARRAATQPAPAAAAPPTVAPAAPSTPTAPAAPSSTGSSSRKATPGPAARRSAARGAPKSVTLTLYGSAENEWSVAVTRGARKPQRSRKVTPESVDAAVRELGDPAAAEAVTTLLHAAREEAQRRVEELSRELEAARQALAALDDR
ncbi:DUF6319 family protein [Gordonia iterans]